MGGRVCWDPELDRQTERVIVSFGQRVQHKGMICTIVIALYFAKCSASPYNVGWEGYIPKMPLRFLRRSIDYNRGIQ